VQLAARAQPPSGECRIITGGSACSRNATIDRQELVSGPKDSHRCRGFRKNRRLVTGMGRASGPNENHHDGRSGHMPGPGTRMDNR